MTGKTSALDAWHELEGITPPDFVGDVPVEDLEEYMPQAGWSMRTLVRTPDGEPPYVVFELNDLWNERQRDLFAALRFHPTDEPDVLEATLEHDNPGGWGLVRFRETLTRDPEGTFQVDGSLRFEKDGEPAQELAWPWGDRP
jgi:hypothetical protein